MKISRLLPVLLLASFSLPTGAGAQAVAARVMQGEGGEAVVGALVSLVDATGKTVVAGLSDRTGRVLLRAPAAGEYRVRAEEVGYTSASSRALTLGVGETVERELKLSPAPVQLEGIVARAGPRCVVRRGESEGVDVVWEEARKALNATAWTEALKLVTLEARRFERDLEPGTLQVLREFFRDFERTGGPAYESRPAQELAERGYVRREGDGWMYYAPDARVLLSDDFLETHCFRLESGTGENAGRIGLAFQPVRDVELPDIDGVLWLNPATSELQYLEFRFVRLPGEHGRREAGGRVHFRRLPSGAWIVDRWRIRAQLAELQRSEWRGQFIETLRPGVIRELGGEVTSVTEAGAPAPRTATGVIEGTIVHPPRESLPAGVRAYVSGTSYRDVADGNGRFRITGLPPGRYSVTLTDSAIALLGYPAPRASISLDDGQIVRVRLEYPSAAELFASACAGDTARAHSVVSVYGVLRDSAGAPASDHPVRVNWGGGEGAGPDFERPGNRMTITDGQGRFRICRLPPGRMLQAETREGQSWRRADRFGIVSTGLVRRDLSMEGPGGR